MCGQTNFLPALPVDIFLFLPDSQDAVWGSTLIGRGVLWPWCHLCSVGEPQHESRHQRKWVVIPQGDKLIKSLLVTAKEIKENWGQSYTSATSVCLFISHLFSYFLIHFFLIFAILLQCFHLNYISSLHPNVYRLKFYFSLPYLILYFTSVYFSCRYLLFLSPRHQRQYKVENNHT